jgi:hypothetical protein
MCYNFQSIEADTSKTVKLVEAYDVWADRSTVLAARNYASRHLTNKPGYALIGKLLPAVFSTKELGESCGQGMHMRKGETRPPLDKTKVAACKGMYLDIVNTL